MIIFNVNLFLIHKLTYSTCINGRLQCANPKCHQEVTCPGELVFRDSAPKCRSCSSLDSCAHGNATDVKICACPEGKVSAKNVSEE
jgi:hypothetical protein